VISLVLSLFVVVAFSAFIGIDLDANNLSLKVGFRRDGFSEFQDIVLFPVPWASDQVLSSGLLETQTSCSNNRWSEQAHQNSFQLLKPDI
jgi:hypothetical protein